MSTVRGSTFWVSPSPRPSPLSRAGYETISDWVKVGGVGRLPATGTQGQVVQQPTLGVGVYDKGKDNAEPGEGTLECRRIALDPGQVVLRNLCLSRTKFATRIVMPSGSIKYNRGLISGPGTPGESGDDFILETYLFSWVQLQIVTDPS